MSRDILILGYVIMRLLIIQYMGSLKCDCKLLAYFQSSQIIHVKTPKKSGTMNQSCRSHLCFQTFLFFSPQIKFELNSNFNTNQHEMGRFSPLISLINLNNACTYYVCNSLFLSLTKKSHLFTHHIRVHYHGCATTY